MSKRFLAALGLCCTSAAMAQTLPVPENIVHLEAQASVEVTADWLGVVFSVTREGSEPAPLQQELKRSLDTALAEARAVVKAGQVEVRTGQFSLHPRYNIKNGPQGWRGTAELIVEGRDVQTIAQLTGRIQTMSIASAGYTLSREAREKVEAEVSAQAIERYRRKALETAKAFGFSGYALREVHIGGGSSNPGRPIQFAKSMARGASTMADEALPTEAGKATVTATVNGSVLLTR